MAANMIVLSRASSSQQVISVSPAAVIGLCILGAILLAVVGAAIYRLCIHNRSAEPSLESNTNHVFSSNPYRNEEQIQRMREVRWINNLYAWERGRIARAQIGEKPVPKPTLKTTPIFPFLHDKDAETWSTAETSGRHESVYDNLCNYSGNAYLRDGSPYPQHPIRNKPGMSPGFLSHDARDENDVLSEPFPPLTQVAVFQNPWYQEPPQQPQSQHPTTRTSNPKIVINDGSQDIVDPVRGLRLVPNGFTYQTQENYETLPRLQLPDSAMNVQKRGS